MSFEDKTGKKGVMISAVDLLKGLAVGSEMDTIWWKEPMVDFIRIMKERQMQRQMHF